MYWYNENIKTVCLANASGDVCLDLTPQPILRVQLLLIDLNLHTTTIKTKLNVYTKANQIGGFIWGLLE